tara:strand:+ start:8537 stop:8707 length:171 start_codon:yes stop_codon:yes gene_type:complete
MPINNVEVVISQQSKVEIQSALDMINQHSGVVKTLTIEEQIVDDMPVSILKILVET